MSQNESEPKPDGNDHVAVLALGVGGEILAAGDASLAIFGWAPGALVGRNIRILLRGGLDNEVGRLLHRHRAGQNPTGTSDLRVVALRKNGSEFPALVTTQTCNWDTTATKKGDTSRPYWTAAFRDFGVEAQSAPPAATEDKPAGEVASGKPQEDPPKEAVAPPPVSPLPEVPPEAKENPIGPAAQPVVAPDLKQRIAELEDQLNKATAELAGAKAEAERLGSQESELRAQLDAVKQAAGYVETALREETARREKLDERLRNLSNGLSQEQAERRQRFEEELVGLRQERDELNSLLAAERQGADEATQRAQELEACLSQNAATFEHVNAELERQTAERERSESSWRQQLDTASIAKRELEGAWAGAVERNLRFEEELANLRREHDELSQKMAAEQKAAAESKRRAKELESRLGRNATDSDRARTEMEKQIAQRELADAEWRKQLDEAKSLQTKLEKSLSEATEQIRRLEEEHAALRQERDDLQNRVKAEQQTAVEAGQRAKELQRRVDQNTAEVERLAADLKKEIIEREQMEARASEQHESAQELGRKLEAERAETAERNVRLEEELKDLRGERNELQNRAEAGQQTGVEAGQRADELQRRLDQNTAELERLAMELKKQKAEREQTEARASEQQEIAQRLARKLEAERAGAAELNRRLEEELAELRVKRDELASQLQAEQQKPADAARQVGKLQHQLERTTADLKRVTAEAERIRMQRKSKNYEWAEKLAPTKALARKLDTEWRRATELIQPQLDQSAPPGPGQLPEYSFNDPASTPARRKGLSSKQRLRP